MSDVTVTYTFTEAWEQMNAAEQRLQVLALHAERYPEDEQIVAAMGRIIRGRDRLREAMGLVERHVAEALIESVAIDLPDIPLAFGYVDRSDEYQTRGA